MFTGGYGVLTHGHIARHLMSKQKSMGFGRCSHEAYDFFAVVRVVNPVIKSMCQHLVTLFFELAPPFVGCLATQRKLQIAGFLYFDASPWWRHPLRIRIDPPHFEQPSGITKVLFCLWLFWEGHWGLTKFPTKNIETHAIVYPLRAQQF